MEQDELLLGHHSVRRSIRLSRAHYLQHSTARRSRSIRVLPTTSVDYRYVSRVRRKPLTCRATVASSHLEGKGGGRQPPPPALHPSDVVLLQLMSGSVEALVVGKVIGDVVNIFTPAAEFTVHYGSRQVGNGRMIPPSAAVDKPTVQIRGHRFSSNRYTLVMVDPDAPSPSEPTLREWLHWIVVDIPEGCDASQGREVVPYTGPQPPTGIHRYIFTLFKQRDRAITAGTPPPPPLPPETRSNFSTRQFAAGNGLGPPVALVYFNSKKERTKRKH